MTAATISLSCDASDAASAVATYQVIYDYLYHTTDATDWRLISTTTATIKDYRFGTKYWLYGYNPNK